eukprot:s164_g11.t1
MLMAALHPPCISWSSTEIRICSAIPARDLSSTFFGMCCLAFICTKLWFVLTLLDFIVGLQYGILMFDSAGPGRWALIACRSAFQSLLSMALSMYGGDSYEEIATATEAFVASLNLSEPCELDEGDAGPRGGVATVEGPFEYLKSPNVGLDRVCRFGGLASVELPWPEDEKADEEEDQNARMEKMTRARSIMGQSQKSDSARPRKMKLEIVEGSGSESASSAPDMEATEAAEIVQEPSADFSRPSREEMPRSP